MNNKIIIAVVLIIFFIFGVFIWLNIGRKPGGIISPLGVFKQKPSPTPKPLEKYEFEKLRERGGKISEIRLEEELGKSPGFTSSNAAFASYLFSYKSDGKKITGLANIPNREINFANTDNDRGLKSANTENNKTNTEKLPVIVMLRGYVDQEIYETGVGTQRAGEYFASQGFITLAPDFLGYGGSDMPPNNVWEERFLRLTSVMDLLASIGPSTELRTDSDSIGIWAHSNGGMIALSILEITGGKYPTSLWAPVSKFFPYDVLFYTDEYDDKGKALRKSLAEFESLYDVNKYSFDEYLDWIKAPIIIHQGLSDPYIPISWTKDLEKALEKEEVNVDLYIYSGADHNMQGSWEQVVKRDLEFFKGKLKKKS